MNSYITCDLPERLAVMRRQDETVYQCDDYLSAEFQQRLLQETSPSVRSAVAAAPLSTESSATSTSSSSSVGGVDVEWRDKICHWCYQVVDHFEFNREIAAISLSYLDRFLCRRTVNRRTFQLVAVTSLYLACKLHEPRKLRMENLIQLSRGYFTTEHIIAMEDSMLNKLSYLVHPPTPTCFLRHLLLLLPENACAPIVKHDIEEVAKFMAELSVFEYSFVPMRKSSVGLAAVLNAMDGVDESRLSALSRERFLERVRYEAGLDPACDEVVECRERLLALYTPEGGTAQQYEEAAHDATREATVSPVSVAAIGTAEMGHHQTDGYCPAR